MKINLKDLRVPPPGIYADCCIYNVTPEIEKWIEVHNLDFSIHPKGYYNINLPKNRSEWMNILEIDKPFDLVSPLLDGFSPNLNKELHIGHLSNLVYASAIQGMTNISSLAILNDTDNHPNTRLYEDEFFEFCSKFNYRVSNTYHASNLKYKNTKMYKSQDKKYKGCKVIDFPDSGTKVMYKSDGSSTYLCQDLALADLTQRNIVYLTGSEQISHFETLKEFYPNNKHIPIGLVTLNDEKVSSRKGNTILLKDLLKEYSPNVLKDTFLRYNISTVKKNIKIEKGLSQYLQDDLSPLGWYDCDNRKVSLAILIAYSTVNPSFLYNYLKSESVKDINIGLKFLGYKI